MATKTLSAKEFLELLRRSELVEADQLSQVLEQVEEQLGSISNADARHVADALVSAELLTTWHCDKLLERKYKGFFLGKYKLLGHLGRGGMSAVYLAEHVLMQRQVAIKVLPRRRVDDSSYLARFQLE